MGAGTDDVATQVGRVLEHASSEAPTAEQREALRAARQRLDEPLRVAIAGRVKAGKSTLLNALVGEELAPTDAGECTRVVTWYRNAHTYRVLLHPLDGPPEQRPFSRDDGAIAVGLGRPADEVDHLEVWWPSRRLHELTLIDTPGLASLSAEVSARTEEFLTADDDVPTRADAVLYLLRHLHAADSRFLESFHDAELAHRSPVNAVGVLSRADEIGSCRKGAMDDARRVAMRYRSDPLVRRLCSTVVPVAGLLGQTGATLREDEYQVVKEVADLPAQVAVELLLTADRYGGPSPGVGVDAARRRALVCRMGLYGVRLADRLVRAGEITTASQLAEAMVRESGIEHLRQLLVTQFGARSRVLKARSALSALAHAVRSGWPADSRLPSEVERIVSAAHELSEIRLLNRVHRGEVELPARLTDEAVRLLGASGHHHRARLGLDEGADDGEVREAAVDAHARWQRMAENAAYPPATRAAAREIVRSCEGVLTELLTAGTS